MGVHILEYFSSIKKNSIEIEKICIRFKITLSERSPSEKAAYCMNSIMQQFGKGNLWRM